MRDSNELASKQFGLLIALSQVTEDGRNKWVCQCRCGNKATIRQEDLLSGRSKSCGCITMQLKQAKAEKKFSLVNRKFGRLAVLWKTKTPSTGSSRSIRWDCRCECGKVVSVAGNRLRAGTTKSCGCLRTSPKGNQ